MKLPTTFAELEACPHCRCAVISALDSPVAGLHIRLEPRPLDVADELAALLRGLASYDLVPCAGRNIIIHRDMFRIDERQHPVLAEHRCPGTIPAAIATKKKRKKKATGKPPF